MDTLVVKCLPNYMEPIEKIDLQLNLLEFMNE